MNSEYPIISWKELIKHFKRQSLWVVIEGMVYDVSTYLDKHPGGEEILRKCGAKDATEQFLEYNHSNYARSILASRLVGQLTNEPPPDNYAQLLKQRKQRIKNPYKAITWEELECHNTSDDAWIVIDDDVYDITDFLGQHPGGIKLLLDKAGDDASTFFHRVGHSQSAHKIMGELQVGIIVGIKPKKKEKQQPTNYVLILFIIIVFFVFLYLLLF
ncbi:unnamed protein product [Paramecium sonneborni]|uniref:Cytochrome b5 heme-binding domain-containing protein n=1 Tax=Paramecium sonneborni TaxID=65129 RepID=A0A8S1RHT4_9CILI|nr:unnamed protein product [Paramecium sonneborni]